MLPEIAAAVGFLSSLLRTRGCVNEQRLQVFRGALQAALTGEHGAEGPAPSGSVPTEGGLPAERPRPVRSLGSWSSAQCLGPGALWFQLAAAFCAVVGAES